jgi:peptidoglycan/LPS O-acetylase OafA/YrhL
MQDAPSRPGRRAEVAGVFVATLVVSMATYHLVEYPARNWMRAHDPFTRKPPPEPDLEPIIQGFGWQRGDDRLAP